MEEKLVTIATYQDYIQADLARQRLEEAGIKAVVTGQNASNVYSMSAIAAPKLEVFEKDAQRAIQILREIENEN